jgi:hypothetical protein
MVMPFDSENLVAEVRFDDITGIEENVAFDITLENQVFHDPHVGCSFSGVAGNLEIHLNGMEDTLARASLGVGSTLETATGGRPVCIQLAKTGTSINCLYQLGCEGEFKKISETDLTLDLGSPYIFQITSSRKAVTVTGMTAVIDYVQFTE